MPLGKFQKGLRLCEGVSLEQRKTTTLGSLAAVSKRRRESARLRGFCYEDAPAAMSFLNLATATSVFS